ncbi:MAG: hypothetical protein IJX96_04040 [Clostridia bacterium]|nr:hypothetical protein [Clostridia bacterium]
MKAYEHIRKFQIKYCDADFKDEMKPSVALSLMEEVACSSADELGFGYTYVKPKGYAFMVTNICVEFLKPIKLGEVITLKTWPNPPSYVVFGREYQILSETEELLASASSRWCLVDMTTGRLLQSKAIDNQDYSTYNTSKALENVKWKISTFKPEEGELKFTLTIANSEYDHNMHVNNTRYADYCFNCFSIAELAEKKLKRFSISYVKQCHEGDTLRFYRKREQDGSYLAHGFNENGEIVVQSQITFEENHR